MPSFFTAEMGTTGNAERGLELIDAHRAAIGAKLVHHVQRKHHGNIELHELQRKIEVSLDIGRVNDVDNGCGRIVDKKIARNDFLIRNTATANRRPEGRPRSPRDSAAAGLPFCRPSHPGNCPRAGSRP